MKFRKKPVVIDAFMVGLHKPPQWLTDQIGNGVEEIQTKEVTIYEIRTLEGRMLANFGDWIIKGVKGELYPCKPEIFEATYEDVID